MIFNIINRIRNGDTLYFTNDSKQFDISMSINDSYKSIYQASRKIHTNKYIKLSKKNYKISYSKNDLKRLNILNRLKESYKQKYYQIRMIHPIENIIQLKRFILNNISYEKMIHAIK